MKSFGYVALSPSMISKTQYDKMVNPSSISEMVANSKYKYLPHNEMCMYTMTRDENFLLDFLPGHPNVVVGSGGSGHAFKFAPFIGEELANYIVGKKSEFDLSFLRYRI